MDDRQELWRGHLARHAAEGGPVRHFCERHGLNPKTFRAWRKRLGFAVPAEVVVDAPASGGSKEVLRPFSAARTLPLHIELLSNVRTRRTWSTEQKQQIVLDLVRSGLSLERFARQQGLTPSVLHRWRSDLIEESRRLQGAPADTPAFASVTVTEEVATGASPTPPVVGRVEIVLHNGRRVIVDADIAPGTLQRLVRVLEMPS